MELFELIAEMMSFAFLRRAVIVGLLVSLCAALLGVSLVLKRYAMIGTGLSHVGFVAMAITIALDLGDLSIALNLPIVALAAFFLLRLNENSKINGDSAVAMVSASSLAIGVIITDRTVGMSLHVCSAMFGSIFAISQTDLWVSVVLSIAVVTLFVLFYKQLFAVTYDESFAKATGTKAQVYKSLLALLTAITVVLGMRMMGALLISSLIIFPALSAMRVCKSFLSVVIASAFISVSCFFVGMVISYGFDLPAGASIVSVNLALFLLFSSLAFVRKGGA